MGYLLFAFQHAHHKNFNPISRFLNVSPSHRNQTQKLTQLSKQLAHKLGVGGGHLMLPPSPKPATLS